MPAALPNPTDCCLSCEDVTITVAVPGTAGSDGSDGASGAAGLNAFTALTAGFTMPAVSGSVAATVADNTWIAANQYVFIENAGYMKVTGKVSTTGITVQNPGYTGNASPTAPIANGGRVSPGGISGTAGSNGSNGDDGINSYTETTASFVMPAVSSTVTVLLEDGSWLGVGQNVYIPVAGYMKVTAKATSYEVTLENLNVYGNAAPTTIIASGSSVAPSGPVGSFNGVAAGDLKGNYPSPKIAVANTKGSIPSGNGTDTTALAVGTNDTVLKAASGQTNGLIWGLIDLVNLSAALQAFIIPSGSVQPFAGSSIPTGWLECTGASLLRADYAALFTAISTTWGSVDGTHFTLPDFRGRSLIGAGTGSGLTARSLAANVGTETYTLLNTDIPDIAPQGTITPAMSGATPPYKLHASQWDNIGPQFSMDGSDDVVPRTAGAVQTDVPLMQPSAVIKWIIKT